LYIDGALVIFWSSGRVSSSCSTIGTRRVDLVTNPLISHEWGKDREVITTSGTYPWSSVIHIFHSGQPSHGCDRCPWNYFLHRWGIGHFNFVQFSQMFLLVKLKSSFRTLYGRNHDLVDRYGIYVSQMTNNQSFIFIKHILILRCNPKTSTETVIVLSFHKQHEHLNNIFENYKYREIDT
jgi:hypothetical protein